MDAPPLCLMPGRTVHVRFEPYERRFAYRLLLIDLDIDQLAAAARCSPLFAIDRPALFSFRTKDHGAQETGPLRPWAEAMFSGAGVALDGGAIRLITFPRHAFYKFAPISVWRGYGPDGALRGAIYEVNNTFGERHCYVAPVPDEASGETPGRARHAADKQFHVSPFFSVDGRYGFTLRGGEPGRFSLIVETRIGARRSHIATMRASARPATSASLLAAAIRKPLSTLGVTAAIHWEALHIWRRGARYHPKPAPALPNVTIAQTAPSDLVYDE